MTRQVKNGWTDLEPEVWEGDEWKESVTDYDAYLFGLYAERAPMSVALFESPAYGRRCDNR